MRRLLVLVVSCVVLGACANEPADRGSRDGSGPSETTTGTTGSAPRRYEVDATVLESRGHGPELCVGGVDDSLPPQCAGVPIANWDWDAVDAEQSAAGTTWGDYHVEGAYDGVTFTATDTGAYRPPDQPAPDFTPPCPEPEGGWAAPDLEKATEADLQATMRTAEAEADAAGFWIDYLTDPPGDTTPGAVIVVATFTGDFERHEAQLRETWGGPMCVAAQPRTLAELKQIQRELGDEVGDELGLQTTWSSIDVTENLVEVGVVVATDEMRETVEERYGEGSVVLEPALTPVG